MVRLLVRLTISALSLAFLLPMIPGIQFHGNFLAAILLAILFSVMVWLVDFIAVAISAVLTVSTFGLALFWLIPLWILGFWLLPAVALKLVSGIVPGYYTIHGWWPAIWGGLVMLVIGVFTGTSWSSHRQIKKQNN